VNSEGRKIKKIDSQIRNRISCRNSSRVAALYYCSLLCPPIFPPFLGFHFTDLPPSVSPAMEQATVPSETSVRRPVCFSFSLSLFYFAFRFLSSSIITPVAPECRQMKMAVLSTGESSIIAALAFLNYITTGRS
jgi:hypothetical protein